MKSFCVLIESFAHHLKWGFDFWMGKCKLITSDYATNMQQVLFKLHIFFFLYKTYHVILKRPHDYESSP